MALRPRNTFVLSSRFLLFPTKVAAVFSQFSTSRLCNMIVLDARLMGTPFRRQSVLSMPEKMDKENALGARVVFSNFKTLLSTRKCKKQISCHGHFNMLFFSLLKLRAVSTVSSSFLKKVIILNACPKVNSPENMRHILAAQKYQQVTSYHRHQ